MRIIHTCLRYPPATGGVETYVNEIVDRTHNLSQNRDVRVLTSKMRTHGPISQLNPNLLLDDPMYVQRLHHAASPFVSYPILQALKYYLGHHAPDVVHGHSFWYQPADVAARYAHRHNIPFIFHPYYYESMPRRKAIWQLYKRTIGKNTFAAADVVVVISPFEKNLIEKAGFPVRRFELIPPGIDTDKYSQRRANPYHQYGISGTILLAVCRIASGKGLNNIISALPVLIKQHNDINLVIIGEDFGAQKELTQQANNLGITKHVHFLGKVSADKLISAYQHADIFVHPSHYEAFGIVLAEALAAGTPVVARNAAAIPFVVPDRKVGLLFNNTDQLINNTLQLLNNSDLRDKLAHTGINHVKQNFSWSSSINKITNLYREFKG